MRRLFLLAVLIAAPAVVITSPDLRSSAVAMARSTTDFLTNTHPAAPAAAPSTDAPVQMVNGDYPFFVNGVPPLTVPTDIFGSPAMGAMGVYLTPNVMNNLPLWNEYLDALQKAGGNSFVVAVKGGQVFFETSSPIAKQYNLVKPAGDLKAVVAAAKARGLYTIARYIALKDNVLATVNPDTQVKHPQTGAGLGEIWVDGANPTVLQYNREVLTDLVATGIDEINLDYIRFPTEYPGILNMMTTEEKIAHIEPFVKMAREVIDQHSPSTKLGLSTYAILGWNYPINLHALGQDVVAFNKYVDIISPMAYPSTFTSEGYYVPGKHPGPREYYLVWRTLEGYKKLLGDDGIKKLRPWIQGYFVDQEDVLAQIRAVHDAGLCGFSVWNASNNYEGTFKAMARMPAQPAHCLE